MNTNKLLRFSASPEQSWQPTFCVLQQYLCYWALQQIELQLSLLSLDNPPKWAPDSWLHCSIYINARGAPLVFSWPFGHRFDVQAREAGLPRVIHVVSDVSHVNMLQNSNVGRRNLLVLLATVSLLLLGPTPALTALQPQLNVPEATRLRL